MDQVLLVVAVGALVLGAAVLAPLVLPWPQRVRWLVIAQVMGHDSAANWGYPPLDLREVVLASVKSDERGLGLEVLEVGRPVGDTVTLVRRTAPDPECVSMLHEWCALRTPMLLYVDRSGVSTLSGPAATITALRTLTPLGEAKSSGSQEIWKGGS